MANKHISVRMDDETREKAKYIAERSGRSLNAQIIKLIETAIERYEKRYGEIDCDERESP